MGHDVVVLGASVAGLTAARRLALDGYDVLVLDPNPEDHSAAIGHGVAAVGHASTVATMTQAYGVEAAQEHARRNVAAIEEIRQTYPQARCVTLRDSSLPGGDQAETREVAAIFTAAGSDAQVEFDDGKATVVSQALLVTPADYAQALRTSTVEAGAEIVYDVTVTSLARREGSTKVWFRNNRAWIRDLGSVSGVAVIDTLGISPWGKAARSGVVQWVPVVSGTAPHPCDEVRLAATGQAWLTRPTDNGIAVFGRKTSDQRIAADGENLARYAADTLGLRDPVVTRMAIDPSDHGRPIVGASAIPGGFYSRGNGRGELTNGTASGYYLWQLLTTKRPSSVGLPPLNRLRARLLRRR